MRAPRRATLARPGAGMTRAGPVCGAPLALYRVSSSVCCRCPQRRRGAAITSPHLAPLLAPPKKRQKEETEETAGGVSG
ncbi:hypothetical protein [Pandoravirus japonicus]|uniref:Uncharacterized protein n=1 Tax=Pandoravirus japonicus TaxID=2823154 RepID=A0A811BNQ0_9VIRU|nr:hypothetical protein [Pandoravirus japonicus]